MTDPRLTLMIHDIASGFSKFHISWELALEDLRERYRRSYIGLIWVVVSFIAFISIKQIVFSQLFPVSGDNYFSHLVIGFALFTYCSAIVPGAANLFVSNRTWILSSNLPYTLYANKLIFQAMIELGLLTIASALLIGFGSHLALGNLWSIPLALVVYYLSSLGLCLMLAPLGALFRDSVYLVQTIMRMLFFATPIIWLPTPGTMRGTIAKWNPLTYYLEIIREPLISGTVPTLAWLVTGASTLVLLLIGSLIFALTRKRIAHWL